jgi:GTP-binding protein EngB required for normal cell division
MSIPSTPSPSVSHSKNGSIDKEVSHTTLRPLLSVGANKILDLIDDLRHSKLEGYQIRFPKIVVCGDTSVGKSSVLEAISKFNFPRAPDLCTRFTTELCLRHGEKTQPEGKILWKLGNPEEKLAIKSPVEDSLDEIITMAGDKMQKRCRYQDCSFFQDVLQVTASDPSWPAVTLVDLPGLVKSGMKAKDEIVSNAIVEEHIKENETIILAIVQATNIWNNQGILKLARKYDPKGTRTLVVITKPDLIENDKDLQQKWIEMTQNKQPEYKFDNEWHVVKNRTSEQHKLPISDWDESEKKWFKGSIWEKNLSSNQLGTRALHVRLSNLLEEKARLVLPGIVGELTTKLTACRERLKCLGEAYSTKISQQSHLLDIAKHFSQIVRFGSEAHYRLDPYFNTDETKTRFRKLISDQNDKFIEHMRGWGQTYEINEANSDQVRSHLGAITLRGSGRLEPPEQVTREGMEQIIERIAKKNRGKEFSGTTNLDNYLEVFKEQSTRWESIAKDHILNMLEITFNFLLDVLRYVEKNPHTARILENEIIRPLKERKRQEVEAKLKEILLPYTDLASFSYNPGLAKRAEEIRQLSISQETQRLTKHLLQKFAGNEETESSKLKDAIQSFEGGYIKHASINCQILDLVQTHYEVWATFW